MVIDVGKTANPYQAMCKDKFICKCYTTSMYKYTKYIKIVSAAKVTSVAVNEGEDPQRGQIPDTSLQIIKLHSL